MKAEQKAVGICFPATGKRCRRPAMGVFLAVVEGVPGRWDTCCVVRDQTGGATRKGGGVLDGGRVVSRIIARAQLDRLSDLLASLGSPHRLRLMIKLLEGPARYRSLQRVTRLKAGPLYHHVNQLRLAGLIRPRQRDLYELTRGGRNLLLVALSMGRLARDRRRRPVPLEK